MDLDSIAAAMVPTRGSLWVSREGGQDNRMKEEEAGKRAGDQEEKERHKWPLGLTERIEK